MAARPPSSPIPSASRGAPGSTRRSLPGGGVGLLAAGSFVIYVGVALWMRGAPMHFVVGDSMARTANAVYVVASRDPHLAAMGFYWLPLPSLIQIPLVVALEPFHAAELAGPLSSAACMAATVVVLGRICRNLGIGHWTALAVCVLFAANPVMVWTAANGMSEACSYLTLALALSGLINWVRRRRTGDLVTLSVGLAAAVMVRFEAVAVAAIFALIAGWVHRDVRRSLWTAFVVVLPSAFTFGVWMAAQWVLVGDPLQFRHLGGKAPKNPFWLPNPHGNPLVALGWGLRWLVIFGPALVVVGLSLRKRAGDTGPRVELAVLAGAGVLAAINGWLLLNHNTFGDPRYFEAAALFAAVGVAWMLRPGALPAATARWWRTALLGCLALDALSGTLALTDPKPTHVEGESIVFRAFAGRGVGSGQDPFAPYRRLVSDLDPLLGPHHLAMADTTGSFAAVVISRHPERFVIPNDRDFEPIAADPRGRVSFLIVATVSDDTHTGNGIDLAGQVRQADPTAWELVKDYDGVQLYRFVPTPSSRGNDARPNQLPSGGGAA